MQSSLPRSFHSKWHHFSFGEPSHLPSVYLYNHSRPPYSIPSPLCAHAANHSSLECFNASLFAISIATRAMALAAWKVYCLHGRSSTTPFSISRWSILRHANSDSFCLLHNPTTSFQIATNYMQGCPQQVLAKPLGWSRHSWRSFTQGRRLGWSLVSKLLIDEPFIHATVSNVLYGIWGKPQGFHCELVTNKVYRYTREDKCPCKYSIFFWVISLFCWGGGSGQGIELDSLQSGVHYIRARMTTLAVASYTVSFHLLRG